jgi:2-dehydro-3-deoxygluconokinase
MCDVLTAGEAMLLLLAEPGQRLAHATALHVSVAGAEANVSIALTRLGHRVRWLGRVGADPPGERVLRTLRAEGVDSSRVAVDPSAPTGLLLRDSHRDRVIDVRYYRTGSAATRWAAADVHASLLVGVRAVHVTGVTAMLSQSCHAAVTRLLDLAHEANAHISIDPNVRHRLAPPDQWAQRVGPLLARADLVFAGTDELALVLGPAAPQRLLDAGVSTVVVKQPDKTVTAHSPDGQWTEPPQPVSAVDPVGAGDAFAAGYLSAWLDGLAMPQRLHRAAVVASFAVQRAGDIEGLPTRVDLDAVSSVDVTR